MVKLTSFNIVMVKLTSFNIVMVKLTSFNIVMVKLTSFNIVMVKLWKLLRKKSGKKVNTCTKLNVQCYGRLQATLF